MPQIRRRLRLDHKPLHKHAVDAVLLHPLKMPQHRFRWIGTEDVGRAAIAMFERRDEFFVVIQLTHVRPKIDVALPRLKPATRRIMMPPQPRPIARASKPTLIPRHHLAGERGSIDTASTWAGVGLHGGEDFTARWRF